MVLLQPLPPGGVMYYLVSSCCLQYSPQKSLFLSWEMADGLCWDKRFVVANLPTPVSYKAPKLGHDDPTRTWVSFYCEPFLLLSSYVLFFLSLSIFLTEIYKKKIFLVFVYFWNITPRPLYVVFFRFLLDFVSAFVLHLLSSHWFWEKVEDGLDQWKALVWWHIRECQLWYSSFVSCLGNCESECLLLLFVLSYPARFLFMRDTNIYHVKW